MENLSPIVSVCMITYNHESFIAQAIEGVMIQETSFPFELIIGEDCSTDTTRKICLEYQAKYLDKIKLILPESNLGMMRNFVETLQTGTGKYIALCEGDDYWTDPLKLQMQVDFLEANEDYSICFHPVRIWKDGCIVEDYITSDVPETTEVRFLAKGNYLHTPSVVFRRNQDVFEVLSNINTSTGDYVLHLLNSKYGKIKRLTDLMAVYRVHSGGVWSETDCTFRLEKTIETIDMVKEYFDSETNVVFSSVQSQYYKSLIRIYKDNEDKSKYYSLKIIENDPFIISKLLKHIDSINQFEKLKQSNAYCLGNSILNPKQTVKRIINRFMKSL